MAVKGRPDGEEKRWSQSDIVRLVEMFGSEEVAAVFAAGGDMNDLEADLTARRRAEIARLKREIKRLKQL